MKKSYLDACHANAIGCGDENEYRPARDLAKHLRVGVNCAMSDNAATGKDEP